MRVCAGRDPCVTTARCGWTLQTDNFVFLLSSKAGGCGINLIGANRHPSVPFHGSSGRVGATTEFRPPLRPSTPGWVRPAGRPCVCLSSPDKRAQALGATLPGWARRGGGCQADPV
jgi:hypothetical protein